MGKQSSDFIRVGAGTVLACGLSIGALAQDATWLANPGSNIFNNGSNWSSGSVPTDTATFGQSRTTAIAFSDASNIGNLTFAAGAPAYSFTGGLRLTGAGVINKSASSPTFVLQGFSASMELFNSATLGNSNVTISGWTSGLYLSGTSSAGTATITIDSRGALDFGEASSGGQARLIATGGITGSLPAGDLVFDDHSNADIVTPAHGARTFFTGSASAARSTIQNEEWLIFQNAATADHASIGTGSQAQTQFQNDSTAGSATIRTDRGGLTIFKDMSSAGKANIFVASGGLTTFTDGSTAGAATITADGFVAFGGTASGGRARLIVNAGGAMWGHDGTMSVGSIEGAGEFSLQGIERPVELVVGGNNLSTEVRGTINGASLPSFPDAGGRLVKVGTGTLTLSGASTLSAGTRVARGGLMVNGTLASDVSVDGGARIGGTGIITGTITNNGTMAAGNPFDTLTIQGTYLQGAGSTYQVAVSPRQSSLLAVTGSAVLEGGSVSVLAQGGAYAPRSTYTILAARGGITGTFSSVASNFSFLTPVLSYTTDSVELTLLQGTAAFNDGALTPNQKAVGRALDAGNANATGDFRTVLDALAMLDTTQGPRALDAIGGQAYSGFGTVAVQSARVFMDNFQGQAGGGQWFAGGGRNRVALAEDCTVACDADGPSRWSAWGGGLGSFGTVAGDANSSGLTYTLGGFVAGLDRRFSSNITAGIATGFTATSLYAQTLPGRGTSDTLQVALYGKYIEGSSYLDAMAGYAHIDNRMNRPISIPGLPFRTAYGQTTADQLFGQMEAGYRVDVLPEFGGFVMPFARLQGSTATQGGFTESGADSLDFIVGAQTTNSLRSVLGAQIGAALDAGWRDKLDLSFRLGWSHEFADLARPVSAAFAGAPTIGFTTQGALAPRDGVSLGFAAGTAIGEATNLYLRYDADLAGANSNHAITGGIRFIW